MAEAVQDAAANVATNNEARISPIGISNEDDGEMLQSVLSAGSKIDGPDVTSSRKTNGGLYTTWEGVMPKGGEVRRKPVQVHQRAPFYLDTC
jgi:hypothetical protein